MIPSRRSRLLVDEHSHSVIHRSRPKFRIDQPEELRRVIRRRRRILEEPEVHYPQPGPFPLRTLVGLDRVGGLLLEAHAAPGRGIARPAGRQRVPAELAYPYRLVG